MWQGSYGKEPFNMRLTILRMIYKIPAIVGVTVLGTVVFGGGYYAKNVLLRNEHVYAATSTYRVDYDVEEAKDVGTVYINQYSWNTYLQTDMFLDAVQGHLMDALKSSTIVPIQGEVQGNETVNGWSNEVLHMTKEELGAMLTATLASDLRVPTIAVTYDNPNVAVAVAAAVEATMVEEFVAEVTEVVAIHVIDAGDTAEEVMPDVRVGRALALSAVLTGFFAIVFFLLKEVWEDGIWLPISVWKRYGVKAAGYVPKCLRDEQAGHAEKAEFGNYNVCKAKIAGAVDALTENLAHFYREKSRVAVCPVTSKGNPEEVLQSLKKCCPEIVGEGWFALPAPEICPEVCENLREADGILLVVPAGAHSGRKVEWTLEYLQQQDCEVTAAVLVDADERLIRNYYRMECNGK